MIFFGKLIVLEGIDGSGKSSQYARVCSRLKEDGIEYRHIVFPRYDKESCALVRLYLNGGFGTDPDAVNAYTASTFFAVDRFASFRDDWGEAYNQGSLILSDRYTTSNAVHQGSKLPEELLPEYFGWLSDLEYNRMQLPKPDLVLYLELPIEVSCRLLEKRYAGDDSKKDLHERDSAYLRACHETASFAARRLGWQVVHCGDGTEGIRTPEEIANEIEALVTQRFFKEA